MRANFKLFPRLLVDVRRAQHRVAVLQRRQRNRSGHRGARALGRVDDITGRLVQYAMVVRLEPNADAFFHFAFLSLFTLESAGLEAGAFKFLSKPTKRSPTQYRRRRCARLRESRSANLYP